MKLYLTTVLLALLMVAPSLMAQDDATVPDDPETADTTEAELNETQTLKAEKLSEASGVSTEEILAMRSGTSTTDPEAGTETGEEAVEQPKGRGWGVIAKFLGLHPGTLGNGTGDKFADKTTGKDEGEEGDAEGVLAKRNRVREERLYGESGDKEKPEKMTGKDRADRQKNQTRGRDRGRDRKEKRDKGERGNKGGRGNSNK